MRVGIMAARAGRAGDRPSRRVRGPAAHRAADRAAACKTLSVCYLPSRAPRRWRGGAMGTSRPTATGPHGDGTRRWGVMAMGRDHGARQWRGMPSRAPRRWRGGAMGTSRPTAKPHEGCARQRGTTMGHGRCARQRGTTTGYGRGVRDAKPRTAVANRHGRGARAGGFSPLGARGGCLRLEQGRWKRRRSWARKGGRRLHPVWNQPD